MLYLELIKASDKLLYGEMKMNLELVPITNDDLKKYKEMAKESFQKGFEDKFGRTDNAVLPDEDIDSSLRTKGSISYKAIVNGEMLGGAVVVIDKETQYNHLDFLFVKYGAQNRGIGKAIWFELEKLHPNTKVWKTYTPYFDKRNIHFYINVCGFYIVEFFNEKHPMTDIPDDFIGDGNEGMFEFMKQM